MIPEAVAVGLFCVLHKDCVGGGWKNVYVCRLAQAKWIDWNELCLPIPSYAPTTRYERLEIEVVDNCFLRFSTLQSDPFARSRPLQRFRLKAGSGGWTRTLQGLRKAGTQ
jgi:hypothetical protein